MPAQAGVQKGPLKPLDSGVRRNDEKRNIGILGIFSELP